MIDDLSAGELTGKTGLATFIVILAYSMRCILLIRKETSISIIS